MLTCLLRELQLILILYVNPHNPDKWFLEGAHLVKCTWHLKLFIETHYTAKLPSHNGWDD